MHILILQKHLKKLKKNIEDKIIVSGGLDNLLGPSTDYDTALFAEKIKADLLINATNIDGVYSCDPRINKNVVKFNKLTYDQFKQILSSNIQNPLESRLFDIDAVDIIKRAQIKTIIVDGRDAQEIIRAVEGMHNGTTIENSI